MTDDRPKPGDKPILCLDFDGVIHSYASGWKGDDIIPDPPVPRTFEWIEEAMKHFKITVYSSRSRSSFGRMAMRKYIREHAPHLVDQIDFPGDKPHAFITIDDRALTFNGDWTIYDPVVLKEFSPWYRSQK